MDYCTKLLTLILLFQWITDFTEKEIKARRRYLNRGEGQRYS